MTDTETVITHLQIIHTWAEFARERDLHFFTAKHLEDIAKWSDDALAMLKEQEEWLRKFQKDKDKLCLEVSEWKHKFHDRPEQEKENGHWIVLEYCANEGIYCSKCMNKIFDRSIKPKKKLSNYCPNCGSKNTHFFNPSTEKIMYSD